MIESSERGAWARLSNVSGNLQSCKSREVNTSINRVSAGTDLRDEPRGAAKVLSVVLKHGPLGTVAPQTWRSFSPPPHSALQVLVGFLFGMARNSFNFLHPQRTKVKMACLMMDIVSFKYCPISLSAF